MPGTGEMIKRKWDVLEHGWTDGKSGKGSKKLRARKKNRDLYYGAVNRNRPRRRTSDHKNLGHKGFRCYRSPTSGKFYTKWVRLRWVFWSGYQKPWSFGPSEESREVRV